MEDLDLLRKKINEIDTKLIALLNERFFLTREVGDYKKENNLPILDSSREKEILDKIDFILQDSPHKDSIKHLYIELMNESKRKQK